MQVFRYLVELRIRFCFCFFSFVLTFCIFFLFSEEFLYLMLSPLCLKTLPNCAFIYTQITEIVIILCYISFVGTCIFELPFFIYQLWCFLIPALYQHEFIEIRWYYFLGLFLFCFGIVFGFFILIPYVWNFLVTYNLGNIQFMPKINEYIPLMLYLLLFSGIIQLVPLMILLLASTGFLKIAFFYNNRFLLYTIILLFISLISPPDFISQLFLFVFCIIFYEISILNLILWSNFLKEASFVKRKPLILNKIKLSK